MQSFAVLVVLGFVAISNAVPRWRVRIVGGEEATPHEFPWQVALNRHGDPICGGSIINAYTVVSAAHCCVGPPSFFTISAGRHNLRKAENTDQTVPVRRVVIHEDYNRRPRENDICLLILAEPLNFTVPSAQPIALPAAGITVRGPAVVSGWGTTSQGGQVSEVLLKVIVPIITDTVCRQSYGNKIFDSMICAGYPQGGKDSCQGDSGGPLVSYVNGVEVFSGIVSWGFGCAQPDFPGVYTETSFFIDWIIANMSLE